jgi:hypothetical protein
MPQGGSPAVSKPTHPDVTNHPNTSPYPAPAGSPTSQFEQPVAFDAITSNKAGQSESAAAPDGGGPDPSYAAQASLRGHKPVNFAAVHGHGVAKRSTGKKTPPQNPAKPSVTA